MIEAAEPLEYICRDCGCPVFAWGYTTLPDPRRCGTCAWIATLPVEDQPAARERLGRPVADKSRFTP